eukprot:CAMPEP_0182906246 /NCGR_PEP_ID=MMETSP0034_2-20130328/33588_2 /TAXON_ID=156128 /ORGANISM="Nephroselmis pyriformis, Strain CCMP717" /LENGTH=162 /DNA_ID=CAMNT_0025041873 /DNA_START=144 /DNA_END=629 /DNA_ORIENTATION=-
MIRSRADAAPPGGELGEHPTLAKVQLSLLRYIVSSSGLASSARLIAACAELDERIERNGAIAAEKVRLLRSEVFYAPEAVDRYIAQTTTPGSPGAYLAAALRRGFEGVFVCLGHDQTRGRERTLLADENGYSFVVEATVGGATFLSCMEDSEYSARDKVCVR